jgi:hypothetical protein
LKFKEITRERKIFLKIGGNPRSFLLYLGPIQH